ncbi:Hypothetical protein MVR_LOCUS374 [uncultured virus]|nr:Hypothetical protein MVR_LOCUS374 [uncultured virus]
MCSLGATIKSDDFVVGQQLQVVNRKAGLASFGNALEVGLAIRHDASDVCCCARIANGVAVVMSALLPKERV